MLYALEALFYLLYYPQYGENNDVVKYQPFALCADKPTTLGTTFFIDGIQYDYEVSYCKTHIISEKMRFYPNGFSAKFYTREFIGVGKQPKIKFGDLVNVCAKARHAIIDSTFNNHTVLSTIAKMPLRDDTPLLSNLYKWVKTRVHNVDGDFPDSSMISKIDEVCNDAPRKEFYLRLLNKADFNITNMAIIDDTSNMPSKFVEQIVSSNLPDEEKFSMLNDVAFTNHSVDGDFDIKSNFQSDGTRRFTELLDYLYDLVRENHIYFFDELGNRMHYDLMVYYIALMLHNSDQSQLFFTTHNILLLEEDFIRRDMVYLVEKDKASAVSSYTRVSDMGLHKNLSLYNAYKIGRLGAKPDLGSPYLDNVKDC